MNKMMKQDAEVSVLLIGGFGHAVWVFDEWSRDNATVRLVGAVQTLADESLDGFLAHPWAAQFTPAIYQDIDEALRAEQPDIVVISTRPDLNPDLIEKSLRAGCHVISEKPIAVDEAGLLRVHAAVEETGKFVLPMLGMHEVPAFTEARDLVAQGAIGEPLLVNARKSYQWGTRAEWFKQRETYGGIWCWIGIHSFNHAAYIIGRNATKVLAAQEQNRCHPDYAPACADCMTGVFLLEGDVQMTVSVDLMRPDGQQAWGDDWVRIVGSEGSLEANPELGTIRLIRKGLDEELRKVTAVAPSFYTAFLTAVTEGADFSELTTQGFRLTESVLTAERACVEERCGLEVKQDRWALSLPDAKQACDEPRPAQRVKGFTLIELLTVIAIIGVLAGILIPSISGVRKKALLVDTTARIRAVGQATMLYMQDHKGDMPPSYEDSKARWTHKLKSYLDSKWANRSADLYQNRVYRDATQDELLGGGAGTFGYNGYFASGDWVKYNSIIEPAKTPLFATTNGSVGGGLHISGVGPNDLAKNYGYTGSTNRNGPSPNHDGTTVYLMADNSVLATDDPWPWIDNLGTSFHPRQDVSIEK